MAVLPIYNSFHPVLKEKSVRIEAIDERISRLIDDMFETLHNVSNGVGLASNQVGATDRVVVIDLSVDEDLPQRPPIVMINPEIVEFSEYEEEDPEGCLSVPGIFEKVSRPEAIKVKYFDRNMNEVVENVSGFLARVMQHEIDHLNGILFYEKVTPLRRTLLKSKLKKIKRGDIEADYPMVNADNTSYTP
ncbi:MAG: peptide deformylase [Candidatus Kapaibacterium sp.]